jgi:hypothetical protein
MSGIPPSVEAFGRVVLGLATITGLGISSMLSYELYKDYEYNRSELELKNQRKETHYIIAECFPYNKTKDFYQTAYDLRVNSMSNINEVESYEIARKRWEQDGRWKQALSERC